MSEWQNGTRNLRFSSNFELEMTINWQWYTLQRSFLCHFVEKFNSKTLIISLNKLLLNIKKYVAKCYPYPLIFRDVWKLFQFDKKIQTQKLHELWDFKYELVIPNTSPYNKFVWTHLDPKLFFFEFEFFYHLILVDFWPFSDNSTM